MSEMVKRHRFSIACRVARVVSVVGALCWTGCTEPPKPAPSPSEPSEPPVGSTPSARVQTGQVDIDPPANRRPQAIPQDVIARFYAPGRKVRSVAIMNIAGQGSNDAWFVKRDAYFAYRYQVAVETAVKENDGSKVVFEQYFADVTQLRGESRKAISLSMPDSPLVDVAWAQLEKRLLSKVPGYYELKDFVTIVDPNLRSTLTYLHEQFVQDAHAEPREIESVVARIDELSGLRLELTYVSGLGVVRIKVLEGRKFDERRLDQLAYHSSLMMDYIMGEESKKPVGTPFEVSVSDIQSLCSFTYDVEAEGTLKLQKQEEHAQRYHEKVVVLEVLDGQITVKGTVDGLRRNGRIAPLPGGYVHYSQDKALVRLAKIGWESNIEWVGEDHLLFGTKHIGKVKVETLYSAELVGGGP